MSLSTIPRPASRAAFERASRLIPGGVNSPARAFGAVGGEPIFIARGEGGELIDVDGRRYVDFVGSWGPLILGHAHPRVVEAIEQALHDGMTFGAPTERESALAELIVAAMPSIERVRFVSSGTEAAMSAIRLARGFTARDVIVKFAGCYHGHVDSLLVQAGSGALTHGMPTSPGVPAGHTADSRVLEFNDSESIVELFQREGDRIAAVILEPVVGNMGVVAPRREFLDAIAGATARYGALLILDEVMTGFRLALGGAQAVYDLHPDLTVLGKIVGGGMPVGAFGGRADIMNQTSPLGPVYQAGTLSGNPLAMAAGIATLRELTEHPPYAYLDELGGRLASGVQAGARESGIAQQLSRVGSMWTLFFAAEPVVNLRTARQSDTTRFARFFWSMLDRGFYLPCSQFEAAFLMSTHTEAQIDSAIAAAREAFRDLARS